MTETNVEIARSAYEAMNKRDYPAFFAAVDPDVEFVLPEGGMNAGTHRGHSAVRQFMESYDGAFENFQVVPEEFFEAGDHVVAFVRQSGRGRASGVEIETTPCPPLDSARREGPTAGGIPGSRETGRTRRCRTSPLVPPRGFEARRRSDGFRSTSAGTALGRGFGSGAVTLWGAQRGCARRPTIP